MGGSQLAMGARSLRAEPSLSLGSLPQDVKGACVIEKEPRAPRQSGLIELVVQGVVVALNLMTSAATLFERVSVFLHKLLFVT